jgi:hypothetical protein
MQRALTWGRRCLVLATALAPFTSTLALRTGWGVRPALVLAALQLLTASCVLHGWVRGQCGGAAGRLLAQLAWALITGMAAALGFAAATDLAGLRFGPSGFADLLASVSGGAPMFDPASAAWAAAPGVLGLAAASWSIHALCYSALLAWFGLSLLPGREPVVTGFARRLNPRFADDMCGYTRGVTWAWCVLFAAELPASAALLHWAPMWWPLFANAAIWHRPCC